jgi:hypothetical protein
VVYFCLSVCLSLPSTESAYRPDRNDRQNPPCSTKDFVSFPSKSSHAPIGLLRQLFEPRAFRRQTKSREATNFFDDSLPVNRSGESDFYRYWIYQPQLPGRSKNPLHLRHTFQKSLRSLRKRATRKRWDLDVSRSLGSLRWTKCYFDIFALVPLIVDICGVFDGWHCSLAQTRVPITWFELTLNGITRK